MHNCMQILDYLHIIHFSARKIPENGPRRSTPPRLALTRVEPGWLKLLHDRQQLMNTPIHHAPMMTNVCITAHSTPEPFSYGFHFVKQVHLPTLRMIPIFLHCLNTPYQPHMKNFKHFLWVMHFLVFFPPEMTVKRPLATNLATFVQNV